MLFNHNHRTCVELNEVWKIQGRFRFNQHLSLCFITNEVTLTHQEYLTLLKAGRISHQCPIFCILSVYSVHGSFAKIPFIFVSQIVIKQIINVFNLNEIHVVLYFPTRVRFFICVFGSVTCNDKSMLNDNSLHLLCFMYLESIYTK